MKNWLVKGLIKSATVCASFAAFIYLWSMIIVLAEKNNIDPGWVILGVFGAMITFMSIDIERMKYNSELRSKKEEDVSQQ